MSETSPHKVVRSKRKPSIAWKYFTKTDHENKASCKQCNRICSYQCGSTGNLMRHMRYKHKELYKSIFRDDNESETYQAVDEITIDQNKNSEVGVQAVYGVQCENSAESPKSPETNNGVEETEQQPMAYYLIEQIDASRGKEIDKQILRTIVKEFYSFNLIESPELISFVSMLNPHYGMPSHKALSNELLPQLYQSTMDEIKLAVMEAKSVALAIDRWTSINNENYISVTAHYLNEDLILKANLLDVVSIQKDSSINISIFLQELVANWRISNKIIAVVTENNPTMIDAIKECQWHHIPCFAHMLNSFVKAGLAEINDVITKVRNIVYYFKRNSEAMENLHSIQNKLALAHFKLKKDVPSRWNSTFDMITKFLKNKDIFGNQLIELPIELTLHDWKILESAVKLLVVFNTITVELCSEKFVPLSKMPYMLRFMLKHVSNIINEPNLPKEVKKMGDVLKKELTTQCSNLETNNIICQSVILDPRFKKRGFPESSFNVAYSSLLKQVVALKNEKNMEMFRVKSKIQDKKQMEFFIDVWSEFRESEKLPEQNLTPDATVEVDAFLDEAYLNMKDNPMTYWANKLNQNKFPILFELVKSRLCVPATSIPCDKIFTKAGNVLLEKRNFLPSGKLKEILFLHQNM